MKYIMKYIIYTKFSALPKESTDYRLFIIRVVLDEDRRANLCHKK